MAATDFSKKCEILGQFYTEFRDDGKLKDFMEYNDIGLPLAFLASEGLSQPTESGTVFIEETWLLFLSALEIEDTGYDSFVEILEMLESRDEQN